jgi:hypothetical protein
VVEKASRGASSDHVGRDPGMSCATVAFTPRLAVSVQKCVDVVSIGGRFASSGSM